MDRIDELGEAAERSPRDPWVWLRLAEAFLEDDGVVQASHLLARVDACAGEDGAVFEALGRAREKVNDPARAVEAYRRAAQLLPDPAAVSVRLASLLTQTGRGAEAEEALRPLLDLPEPAPGAEYEMARALVTLQRYDEALEHAARACAARPDDLECHRLTARIAQKLGRVDEEIDALERVLSADPSDWAAVFSMAVALYTRGQESAAMERLERVAREAPFNATLYSRVGLQLLRWRRTSSAIECLRRVVEAKPDSGRAHFELGCALEMARELTPAIDAYRRALALGGESAKVLFALGRALASLGDGDEAVKLMVKASALAPDDASIRSALATVLSGAAKPDTRDLSSARPRFDGDLRLFSVPELLEFLLLLRATGTLEVVTESGRTRLGVAGGQLVRGPEMQSDAELVDLLFGLITERDGRASFVEGRRDGAEEHLVDTRQALDEARLRLDEGE